MFRYLPEQASEFASEVDWIHHRITDISVFFTVAIVGAMLYFAIRYRRRNGQDHETPHIEGNFFLEMVWTIVPTLICIYVAAYGVIIYRHMREVPKDAITINVWGQQWKWDFEYANGKKTTAEIVVPVNKPIKLVMTSSDVLHSFFIPAMRVKKDTVPGSYAYIYFKPIKTGEYDVFCAEYCGLNHSAMHAMLRVVPEAEYERWLNDDSEKLRLARIKPSDLGKELYTKKTCNTCHSLGANRVVGPGWEKIYGREGKFEDGGTYTADENYITESILNPNKHIVAGFPPNLMPSFEGQLSEDEIHAIIAFMKTLDGSQPVQAVVSKGDRSKMTPVERGKLLFTEKACVGCHSLDGSKIVGPTYKGLYGSTHKLTDGSTVTVNDEYIKHSILKPNDQIVEGFQPGLMPVFEGQLSDADIADLIEYIKSVK